ncbi:hypothetical protein FACS1894127_5470 [Clostridia bacterium]|nr:hypothetical protein FACS1894127_5470 [Clostridia bacterium]
MQSMPKKQIKYDRNVLYEVNLRPAENIQPVRAVPKKEKKPPVWDKLNVFFLLILAGLMGIGCVMANTWANEIQSEINIATGSSNEVKADIEIIKTNIAKSLSLELIEERAVVELGMMHPTPEQYIYLDDVTQIVDFAQYIKENAYDPFDSGKLVAVRLTKYDGNS